MDEGRVNQLVCAVPKQSLYAGMRALQVELQAEDAVPVKEALVFAGIARGQMNGPFRQIEGISMSMKCRERLGNQIRCSV